MWSLVSGLVLTDPGLPLKSQGHGREDSQPEMAPAVKLRPTRNIMIKVIVICVCARTQMCAESRHYTCVCR